MVCVPFQTNETLYRSCHPNYFDSKKNTPKYGAFLPKETDNGKLSCQSQYGREKSKVLEFFYDSFSNHLGFLTFNVEECTSMNIRCCDDADPPISYHASVLFDDDKPKRLFRAKYLLSISKFELY